MTIEMRLTRDQRELLRVATQYGREGVFIQDWDRDARRLVEFGLCEWHGGRLRLVRRNHDGIMETLETKDEG